MPEKITFTTIDKVEIVGDWYTVPTMIGAVILVHMMPTDRKSWVVLQTELAKKNIASLAIDLRGHGDSIVTKDGLKLDYRQFDDSEHQSAIAEVQQAIDWVRSRGVERERMALVGASIGANLALQALIEEPLLAGAVLLSPGADYHGLMAHEMIGGVLPEQGILIISSEDDAESFMDSKKLFEEASNENKTFIPYKAAGHGTNIFSTDKSLIKKIADWLELVIKG